MQTLQIMADYEKTHMVGGRRWKRTTLLAVISAGFVALASVGVWMSPRGGKGQELGTGQRRFERGSLNETGTTGSADIGGAENSGPSGTRLSDPIDAVTGPAKVRDLVGRRVELQVPIGPHINDVAFWATYAGQPLLVVLARDTRDGQTRQSGEPATAAPGAADGAAKAILAGRIEPIPHAEAMHSWGLTNADREQLVERPVYLHVTRIEPISEARSGSPANTTSGALSRQP